MSSITIENVQKYYGNNHILKGFDLHVEDGEFVSFLGASGCGKTTCLRIVSGLENQTSGVVKIGGTIVSDPQNNIFIRPEKRNIGMVFQSYAIWPHMNVFQNIAYPLKVQKVPNEKIKEEVKKILEVVELDGLENRAPNELSGGQQQRVALARGLVARPKVLLLDEPLSNLDAKLREKMRHDIRKIQKELSITCLYVTHDQLEAFSMSDRIVVLNQGVIEQVGSPEQIKSLPETPFVQSFLQ
ncbi:MAG: ABC transporter substrate-binding protein [Halobacteriovoraceae bacterium]|nr:ABC transporter substrate-binding protein [Halobacteriovoraceae bacterium]